MITISVDDSTVQAHLGAFPAKLRERIVQMTKRLGLDLQRHVQAGKLSGQVLKVRTNTLRSSINLRVEEDGSAVTATVGTSVKYAAAHEFGFQGVVTVRAHLRQITQAFGHSINPTTQNVRSYQRRVDLPERSFLRSALRDMTADIEAGYRRAAEEATR
jgi:phage gpG-like protein